MNRLEHISPEGRSIGYCKPNRNGTDTYIVTLVDQVFTVSSSLVEKSFKEGDLVKLYSFGRSLNFDQIKEFADSNKIANYTINGNTIKMNWSKTGNLVVREFWVENGNKVYIWVVNKIVIKGEVLDIKDNKELTPGVYELTNTGNTTSIRRKPDSLDVANFIRMSGVLREGHPCRSTLVFISDVIFDQSRDANP